MENDELGSLMHNETDEALPKVNIKQTNKIKNSRFVDRSLSKSKGLIGMVLDN
jgi:hypothetical protein